MAVLSKRLLLLTGSPSVGKTSILLKTVEALKTQGYNVGGMVSREARSCGTRVGFEISDLSSSRRGWLAHINQRSGPNVGRYRVNLEDLDGVGVEAIVRAVESCDVVVIDEIGPMELFSRKFESAVRKAVESERLVVGVVHWKTRNRLIDEVKAREDVDVIEVTVENRARLHEVVLKKAGEFLKFNQ